MTINRCELKRTVATIASPIALAVLLAACGGGGNSSSTPGSAAQSTPTTTPVTTPAATTPEATPDFGPNVKIFTPGTDVVAINSTLQALSTKSTGFDENRAAVLFMPGIYGSAAGQANPATAAGQIDSSVGFMTSIHGLGASPDDVTINGNLRVGGAGVNALSVFWRSISNMKIVPIQADEPASTMRWSTSQAAPLRRVHLMGNLDLTGGQAVGHFMANSRIEGDVKAGMLWTGDVNPTSGVQDQASATFFVHDSEIGSWQGRSINTVFAGVAGAPLGAFNPGDKTTLDTTPVSRDVPYIYVDSSQHWKVFVPFARSNSRGVQWGTSSSDGTSLPISTFFIAKPSDSVATINDALSSGMNLLLTPGVYKLTSPIQVTRPGTVVMGLGYATLTPTAGTAAVQVGDVPGVILSSFVVDANTQNSDVLVQVGPAGANHGSGTNPTTINDLFVRVGGSYAGSATTSLEVNQNNVLIDHTWLWRADHGNDGTTGWSINQGAHGLVVNGDNVTALGLLVEHFQKSEVIWNGNGGQTVFMESEPPYDVPSQADWMNGTENGYPNYALGSGVTSHSATGMMAWSLFFAPTPIYAHAVIETPVLSTVRFTNVTAGKIFGSGGFEHIINAVGGPIDSNGPASFVTGITALEQLSVFP